MLRPAPNHRPPTTPGTGHQRPVARDAGRARACRTFITCRSGDKAQTDASMPGRVRWSTRPSSDVRAEFEPALIRNSPHGFRSGRRGGAPHRQTGHGTLRTVSSDHGSPLEIDRQLGEKEIAAASDHHPADLSTDDSPRDHSPPRGLSPPNRLHTAWAAEATRRPSGGSPLCLRAVRAARRPSSSGRRSSGTDGSDRRAARAASGSAAGRCSRRGHSLAGRRGRLPARR